MIDGTELSHPYDCPDGPEKPLGNNRLKCAVRICLSGKSNSHTYSDKLKANSKVLSIVQLALPSLLIRRTSLEEVLFFSKGRGIV